MLFRMLITCSVSVAMLFALGCSKSSGSDGPGGITPVVDTGSFKNTVDAAGFKTKTTETKAYFTEMDGMRGKFNGSKKLFNLTRNTDEDFGECEVLSGPTVAGDQTITIEECTRDLGDGNNRICYVTKTLAAGQTTPEIESSCNDIPNDTTTSTSTSTTTTTSTSTEDDTSAFMPTFGDGEIKDCASAFTSFESLYKGIKTQFEQLSGELENPDLGKMEGAGLQKATPSEKAAVAYEFKSDENVKGMSISGKIEGGASDSMIYISQIMAMTIDYKKLFESMNTGGGTVDTSEMGTMTENLNTSFAADLNKKLAELIMDMSMVMEGGKTPMNASMKGQFLVSAGTDKYVKQAFDMVNKTDSANVTARYEMEAKLLDENTIEFSGLVRSSEGEGKINFKIVKDSDNKCSISGFENSMPKDK